MIFGQKFELMSDLIVTLRKFNKSENTKIGEHNTDLRSEVSYSLEENERPQIFQHSRQGKLLLVGSRKK